jgi:DNA polymerase
VASRRPAEIDISAKSQEAASARTLEELARDIDHCRGCPLWENATQGVPGEGARGARVMLVGEQPGDQEDLAGKPFVGPAGKLLDRALVEAGIDRREVFVTNTVKHFSWTPRGKRRLHKKPSEREIAACMDWLRAEIRLVKPDVIVCLGATAAHALLGPSVKVTVERGRFLPSELAPRVLVTVHPSSILRGDPSERERAFAEFVRDLARIRDHGA